MFQKKSPTIPIVQGFIRDIVNDPKKEPVKIEQIISEVARNYSIQDNVLGILSYEGIDSKRGLTLYNEAEYIQKSKEGSISTMQCGNDSTDDIYYYAIKIND